MDWQLADAKNRFSELVTRALAEGPQRVRRRNQVVVIVSEEEYDNLSGKRMGLKDAILHSPDLSSLELERDPSPMRDIQW